MDVEYSLSQVRGGARRDRGLDRRTLIKRALGAATLLGTFPFPVWSRGFAQAAAPRGAATIVQGVDAETLHPHVTTSIASKGIMASIHDKLFERAPDMTVVPGLVERFAIINDETWEFHLRRDVFFHNGEPFDAESVRFTIEHFKDPETRNVYASVLAPVKDVEIVSSHTVRIHTDGPFGLLPEILSIYCDVLPARAGREGHDFHKHPIGTGPFKFVRWVPGERLELERFEGGPGNRKARLDKLVWRPVSESSTRVAELRTGAAQLITNVSPLQAADVDRGDTRLARIPNLSSQIVPLNMLKVPQFRDVRVRQALNYAVNKDAIIRSLLRGFARPLAGPFGPGTEGYDPSLEPYPYDPEKAKQLLAEAGYPNGFDIVLTSPSGRYPNDRLVSEAIAQMWTAVGVRTRVEVMEWGTFVQGVLGKAHDAFFFMQQASILDATIRINFHSGVKSTAWQGYDNPEVNRIIDEAPRTLDAEERRAMYRQMSRILREEAPWVLLYNFEDLYGVSKRLGGWVPYPDGIVRVGDMHLI